MMGIRVVALLSVLAVALGFAPLAPRSSSSATALNVKSKALPFLDAPSKLDGTAVGDFGFDPLGLTNTLSDLSYVKESELKHGRVAMLAAVGWLIPTAVHVPTYINEANPLKAITALGYGPNLQILFAIGCVELASWDKTFAINNKPGDFGFDPMNQLKGKSAAQIADLKLKEIKNGRLAMIAVMGMAAETLIFGDLAFLK